MSQSKRKRIPQSELSQPQRDQINTRKRARYSHKKHRQDDLFPVGIEEEISAEENIRSTMSFTHLAEDSNDDEYMFLQSTIPLLDNRGKLLFFQSYILQYNCFLHKSICSFSKCLNFLTYYLSLFCSSHPLSNNSYNFSKSNRT